MAVQTQTPGGPAARVDPGAELNSSRWAEGRFVRNYDHRQLRPVEVLMMLRHREHFRGRVLELGCGAGRVTGYLLELAEQVHGIDLSPAMIAQAHARYPEARLVQGDIRDLSAYADGSMDVVLATCGILDIFDDAERLSMIMRIRRVLRPSGLFVLSAHNRAHLPRLSGPGALASSRNPLTVLNDARRIPVRLRNRHRLSSLQRAEPGYALVNDSAHDFSLLHYFVDRDAQCRQLQAAGLDVLQCLDLDGHEVGPGEAAAHCVELHYVVRCP